MKEAERRMEGETEKRQNEADETESRTSKKKGWRQEETGKRKNQTVTQTDRETDGRR